MSARSNGEALVHPRESCPGKLGLGRKPSRSSETYWGPGGTVDGVANRARSRSAPSSNRNTIRAPRHTTPTLPRRDRRCGMADRYPLTTSNALDSTCCCAVIHDLLIPSQKSRTAGKRFSYCWISNFCASCMDVNVDGLAIAGGQGPL